MQTSPFILLPYPLPFLFNLALPLPQEAKHRLFAGVVFNLYFLHDGRSGRKARQRG